MASGNNVPSVFKSLALTKTHGLAQSIKLTVMSPRLGTSRMVSQTLPVGRSFPVREPPGLRKSSFIRAAVSGTPSIAKLPS
jgi:hypothetical protein